MTTLNNGQVIKECRAAAKSNGMTFKTQNKKINGNQTYQFVSRKSGAIVIANCTLGHAYNLACAGDLEKQ